MKKPTTRILLSLTVILIFSSYCSPIVLAGWKAGTGRVVITPEQSMWMSGYAGRDRPAEGKVHDLWAKTLVLQDDTGTSSLLISLDVVGISRELSGKITDLLQQELNLSREQIAICCSHTHCGPVLGETLRSMYFLDEAEQQKVITYTRAFPAQVLKAARQALNRLEPVEIAYGIGQTEFAVNRRENIESEVPRLREENALKGPVDHAVPTLKVIDRNGIVKAIAFGYACHATTLGFFQWCGDWPGYAQIELEKIYPEATALFVAGCGADQNPLPRRTVELAEKYGKMAATAVTEITPQQWTSVTPRLKMAYQEIALPFSELPSRQQLAADTKSADRYVASRAVSLLRQWDDTGSLISEYPYPIQTWRLGSVEIVFLGGEVVVDYALRLKGDFDRPQLWVAGYANDVMAYIPSRRVLLEGGYEGERSMIYYGLPTTWAAVCETLIVDQVGQLLAE